jgi:hypothetical protein
MQRSTVVDKRRQAASGSSLSPRTIGSNVKHYLFIGTLALSLFSCKKDDCADSAIPTSVTAGFNQDFRLYYRQQASLPASNPPELVLEVADLLYTICPKNANCFTPDFAVPTLRITDAQGQSQEVTIPTNTFGHRTPAWIDTASFRANGRRYLLTYVDWKVKGDYSSGKREDISVGLRVTKFN